MERESMDKIFSLQTKTHLVAWSVIFGLIADKIVSRLYFSNNFLAAQGFGWGWPMSADQGDWSMGREFMLALAVNFLFWTAVFFYMFRISFRAFPRSSAAV